MSELTEQEADQLKSLLDRAIQSGQFVLGIESPFATPEEDLFGEGDRHDGACVTNQAWQAYSMLEDFDDTPPQPRVKLLIDQRLASWMAGEQHARR